jgi:hypothetical protein
MEWCVGSAPRFGQGAGAELLRKPIAPPSRPRLTQHQHPLQ